MPEDRNSGRVFDGIEEQIEDYCKHVNSNNLKKER